MQAPKLSDGVVTLRAVEEADLDDITAMIRTHRDISEWTRIPWPYERRDADEFFARQAQSWADGTSASFVITDASTQQLLGAVGCNNIEVPTDPRTSHLTNEIGYWLHPDARGHGFVTRAVDLLVAWCFDERELDVVRLQTMHGNDASRAVAHRLGFTYVGRVLAQDVNDECRDAHRYELARTDSESGA